MVEKKLFDYFTERFKENLPGSKTQQEAFAKTNEQLGFEAYTSFRSYNTMRKRKARK